MTQKKYVLLRTQNWYPALEYNRTLFGFYSNISDCVGLSFSWGRSPQGAAYWQFVYNNLLHQNL